MPAFKVTDLPDLTGRVFVITGGTAGLGLASAKALASRNATVIICARNEERGQTAVAEVTAENPQAAANVSFGAMDNGDLKSVKAFAEWFLSKGIPLHGLLLNAGIAAVPHKEIDGLESQFYVNHLSHFYLCQLLLEKVKQSAPSRIVFVSSGAHESIKEASPDWSAVSSRKYSGKGDAFNQYGYTKLANVQTATRLQELLEGSQVYVNSLHPGVVATEIFKKMFSGAFGIAMAKAFGIFMKSPETGALTQLYLVAHPEVETLQHRGAYFVPTAEKKVPAPAALNAESRKQLWDVSESLIRKLQ